MKKAYSNFLLGLSIFVLSQNFALACSCDWTEFIFCRCVYESTHILSGYVSETFDGETMEVVVVESFNQTIEKDTIKIFTGPCSVELGIFELSDTLILGLENYLEEWYLPGVCVQRFLRVENAEIIGDITDSVKVQSILEFKENLEECIALEPILSVDEIDPVVEHIEMYPNPAQDYINIKIKQNSLLAYQVYDQKGRQIINVRLSHRQNECAVNVVDLMPGIYFLKVKSTQGSVSKKFQKH